MNCNLNSMIAWITKAEPVKRQKQAHAARLYVSFLERPVFKKAMLLFRTRYRGKCSNFFWCETSICYLNFYLARAYIFDIHTHGTPLGDCQNDDAVRVRNAK